MLIINKAKQAIINNPNTHLSYMGLQNCTEYATIYPPNSSNLLNWQQYITIGIYNFNP